MAAQLLGAGLRCSWDERCICVRVVGAFVLSAPVRLLAAVVGGRPAGGGRRFMGSLLLSPVALLSSVSAACVYSARSW